MVKFIKYRVCLLLDYVFFQDTTHQKIDDSFRDRIQQISENISVEISQVIADTKDEQSTLLTNANDRMTAIEKKIQNSIRKIC